MKIGVLFGMENIFPPALVERINAYAQEWNWTISLPNFILHWYAWNHIGVNLF